MKRPKAKASMGEFKRTFKVTASRRGLVNAGGVLAPIGLGKPLAGRNAPCPCGSGKKHKKCHGARVAGRSAQSDRLGIVGM